MIKLYNLYKIIGGGIEQQRKSINKTQEQFAKECGIKRVTYINIENGKHRISIDTLYMIANYLTLSISQLLPSDEDVKKIILDSYKNKFDKWSDDQLNNEEKKEIKKILKNT